MPFLRDKNQQNKEVILETLISVMQLYRNESMTWT